MILQRVELAEFLSQGADRFEFWDQGVVHRQQGGDHDDKDDTLDDEARDGGRQAHGKVGQPLGYGTEQGLDRFVGARLGREDRTHHGQLCQRLLDALNDSVQVDGGQFLKETR